ncbi:MAG: outer membrane protein assembly factor BamD [bacterium]
MINSKPLRVFHGRLIKPLLVLGVVALIAPLANAQQAATNAPDPKIAEMTRLIEGVQRDPGAAPSATLLQIMTLGRETARPQAAAAVLKSYLAQRRDVPAELLLPAAETAERAGDLRTAVARYKQFLKAPPAGAATADATLRLFRLLVDSLGADDDAFRLMKEMDGAARATPALKHYDRWYLDQAKLRGDTVAVAHRLAALMADGMPLEMERTYYWDILEWLTRDIAAARPELAAAVEDCRRISGLIRENNVMAKRFAFRTSHLAFVMGPATTNEAALAQSFEPVAAAARTYIDAAPSADTVHEIARTFAGGFAGFDDTVYRRCFPQKAAIYAYAFGKLNDRERDRMLGVTTEAFNAGWWPGRFLTEELGAQVLTASPDYFRKSAVAAALLSLPYTSTNAAVHKALAPAAQGVPSGVAAIITALGSHDDLYGCWQSLVRDSWFNTTFDEAMSYMSSVWSIYSQTPREAGRLPASEYYYQNYARFGSEVLSKTPVFLFRADSARAFIDAAWGYTTTNGYDRSFMPAIMHQLDWIPFTAAERKSVFEGAFQGYTSFAQTIRSQQSNTNIPQAAAAVPQLALLEAAFKQVMDPAVTDLTKAPNDLCRNLARAQVALREKNQTEFLAAARAAYPLLRDYPERKTPFGRAALLFLIQNRLTVFDTLDFQCEVLTDQLARGTPESGNALASMVVERLYEGRQSWWSGTQNKASVLKVNAVYAKALRDGLARNQFSAIVFEWFRNTRKTSGWQELGGDTDLMEALITRKDLVPGPGRVVKLMAWVRDDFPTLKDKYPVESAFDTALVEEARQTRFLDRRYYDYGGQDKSGAVMRVTAELFQTYERLPFGYDGGAVVYNREWFWDLQGRPMGLPAAERDALLTRIESYGGKTRFDNYANGAMRLGTTLAADDPDGRKKFFGGLATWSAARALEPVQPSRPGQPSLSSVVAAPDKLTDSELDALVALVRLAPKWTLYETDEVTTLISRGLLARKRTADLLALIPDLWGMARMAVYNEAPRNQLITLANAAAGTNATDLAAAIASCGLEVMGSKLKDEQRNALLALKSKAVSGMLAVVSLERSDRRFPLFKAQADFQVGKYEEAWQACLNSRALYGDIYRELDPEFSLWVLGRYTDVGNYTEAETMARLLIQWVDQSPQSFDPETRGRLLLAYAQISFARQEYPRARAIYEQVASAKEFEGTAARCDAEFKIAGIDRLTRHYDKAIERLEAMLRRRDLAIQAEANYQLALVKFDQEEYPEARACVEKTLAALPSHANARILGGKLYLKMKKLVEATDVRVGMAANQETLTPGRPLKISLEDRNLGLVGQAASIEVRVWVDSGDEEIFTLLPFGDSKTKFEGQIPTALAQTRKGDRTLQVLGGDVVHFDYSDVFKKANKISGAAPVNIRVVSDAELYVSSGAILSREEREQRQLEALIRQRLEAQEKVENTVALSTLRADDEIKPGNPITVRVVDPDESTTPGTNSIRIKVAASSGDQIAGVVLKETAPYSGVFEGRIPTTSAQATALATDSAEGRDPNYAITGAEYPPWMALADNRRPKVFSVDLNASVVLGPLKLVADVPGRKLRQFLVQASPNGADFVSLGMWPTNLPPWQGAGMLEVARYAGQGRGPVTLRECRDYLEVGALAAGLEKAVVTPPPLTLKWTGTVNGLADRLQIPMDGPTSWYVGHVKIAFLLKARTRRTFRLASADGGAAPENTFVMLDGEAGPQPREVSRSLGAGMHWVDVYFSAMRRRGISLRLETDVAGKPELVPATAEMFVTDPKWMTADIYKESQAIAFTPATITNSADNGTFAITFPSNTMARVIRLWLLDFEGDAPTIRKLHLAGADGTKLLPTAQDVMRLRENNTLEIVPGDRITVTYEDPHFISKERQFSEAFMKVTFHNATLSACFIESEVDGEGNRKARYIPMRRFKPGDAVNVFIRDSDCDVSDAQDVVKLRVRAGAASATSEVEALETEAHSGIFLARVFPVGGTPQRPSEIHVGPEDDMTLTYRDIENTNPGIPWDRTFGLEQSGASPPELRVYDYSSRELSADEIARLTQAMDKTRKTEEIVPVIRTLVAARLQEATNAESRVILGCPLIAELTHPEVAQSPLSRATLYVQTAAGRAAYGKAPEGTFDVNVPGTIRVEIPPSVNPSVLPPPGYRNVALSGVAQGANALDEGRFTFVVPLKLGSVPATSLVGAKAPESASGTRDGRGRGQSDWNEVTLNISSLDANGRVITVGQTIQVPALTVRGGDTIFMGYSYKDAAGSNRWMTSSATVTADAFFDVMDRRYQESLSSLHVGETLYLRVINPGADRQDGKDELTVGLKTASGNTQTLALTETFGHSGIFKGVVPVLFAGDPGASNVSGTVRATYGDTLDLSCAPEAQAAPLVRRIQIFKGDNGRVMSFTKRFKEPSIAVQTQFTQAEAYFEMAKKHRELAQEELARREIAQGKKLLEEAIRDYPNTEARAQADYLLADLALEFAAQTGDADQKSRYFSEAVSRFTDIVASHPDSPYAPKAQYKKALTYEKMGRIDEACEEYVKLSYRYPDNELVAETIARLGQYFLTKGKGYQEKMAAATDAVTRERIHIESVEMYKTAAQVFGRLQERFPDHKLAGKSSVLAGQCYMRAEDFPKAIEVFKKVIDAKKVDPDLIAEAMYWCGDSYVKAAGVAGGSPDSMVNAYRMFKKITWDYPEGIWAKYARGRLSEDALSKLDTEAEK